MQHIWTFEDWSMNEYRSKNANLYKVASSETPVIGKAIFQENDLQNFYAIRRKIGENVASYKKHIEMVTAKDKQWREDARGKRDEKGSLQWYDTAAKARNLAMKIVEDSAEFMHKFNDLYDSLKDDLLGTDHTKIAQSIVKILEIYPHSLIDEAGKLKRLKKMKIDSDFINSALKWSETIRRMYDNLEEAGKLLGKSEKQIEAARKQSLAQRMRWGM